MPRRRKRHAPAVGYDSAIKADYRRKVWRWIDRQFANRVPTRKRRVAYLDTSEGLETRYLLGEGYSPDRLHAVNFNPAEVANLTRKLDRDGLPRVRTHGVDFARTIVEAGPWDVMAFDGCGPISGPNTIRSVRAMMSAASHGTIAVVNVLGGREVGVHAELIRDSSARGQDTHGARQLLAMDLLGANGVGAPWMIRASRRGRYVSPSGQAMVWIVARLIKRWDWSPAEMRQRLRVRDSYQWRRSPGSRGEEIQGRIASFVRDTVRDVCADESRRSLQREAFKREVWGDGRTG